MKGLIYYEHTRFWRSGKNIVVLLAFAVVLLGLFVFNTILDKSYWSKQTELLYDELTAINNEISAVEAQTETAERNNPEDTEALEELARQYDYYRSQYLFNYQQRTLARLYSPERAQERIELAIERDKHILKGLEAGYDFLGQTQEQVKQRIGVNEYIIQQEITPLNSPHEMNATNFLSQLTDYPWILAILIALALLSIDIFSGDIEGGAYKHLYSQPINRGRIFAVKYLVRFFYSFIIVTGLIALVFGIVYMLNGLGSTGYPMYYYGESYQSLNTTGTLAYLPWSEYMLKTIPLYCFLCLFVMLLIGAASLLLQNTGNTLNASFCILVLDFLGRTLFPAESKFYMFWPLTAAGVNRVLQGAYTISALAYLILLSIAAILLFVGGQTVLRKQDLTGGIGL